MGSLEAPSSKPAPSLRKEFNPLMAHDYPPSRSTGMEGKSYCREDHTDPRDNSECTVEMSPGFGGRRSEFEPYLCHKIKVQSWASLNSLSLSFPICKLGVKIHPTRLLGASAW